MRGALLCLAIAGCSSGGQRTPTVEDVQKRIKIACRDRQGMMTCGAITDPLHAAIFYRSEESPETAKVSSVEIKLQAASAQAALAQLHTMLDGLIPAAHFEGMTVRFSGPAAEKLDHMSRSVAIDGVEVTSGVSTNAGEQPRFEVHVWYR